jgi:NAD(P)-dependent dehydrogenase (short-subunit alcohol dehydrogenase family)
MSSVKKIEWQDYVPGTGLFSDSVILVTGAAGGIGRTVTIALAAEGATVIMLDRKLRHMEKLYDMIVEQGHTEPVLLPRDLLTLDPKTCEQIAAGIEADFGSLTGILHNAAELGSPSPLAQYSPEAWSQVMQVNLQAPWILTRTLMPLLEIAPRASVLFSSAACGRDPAPNWGAYAIAYAGVEAQVKIWAAETENISNIRFNSIDPGPVNTEMRRRSHPGESPAASLSPDDIAAAYLYLLGEDSHSINGQSLIL